MKVLDSVSAVLKQKGGRIWLIRPDASVYEALELMANQQIGALLVMDGEKLLGLVSEREYARKVALKGRSSKDTSVHEIMLSPPVTVNPDCSVDQAMHIMTNDRVRHLPVVDRGGEVLGVVSIGDLVKYTITSHEKTIEQLHSYISGQG